MSGFELFTVILVPFLWMWGMAERYWRKEAERDRDYLRGIRGKWVDERNKVRDQCETLLALNERLRRTLLRTHRSLLALQTAVMRPEGARVPAVDPSRSTPEQAGPS